MKRAVGHEAAGAQAAVAPPHRFDVVIPPRCLALALPVADDSDGDALSPRHVLDRFATLVRDVKTAEALSSLLYGVVDYLSSRCVIACRANDSAAPIRCRVVEVELYVTHSQLHDDPFTHVDPLQRRSGQFYFHRKGGSFKGGSFKGLDITFGTPEVPCGALIRSVAVVGATDAGLTDGPSLVVDKLLALTGATKIADLVAPSDGALSVEGSARLSLERWPPSGTDAEDAGQGSRILVAPRVGLVPRVPAAVSFAGALLRFVVPEFAGLMKHRGGLVAGALAVRALHDGEARSPDPASVGAWIKAALNTTVKPDVLGLVPVDIETSADAAASAASLVEGLLGSDKLNTAPGAAALVAAAIAMGGMRHALPPSFESLSPL